MERLNCMIAKPVKYLLIGLAILSLSSTALLAASDISNAKYKGRVSITSGTEAAAVSVPFDCSTANMISADMLNDTATDATVRNAAGTDIAFMPGYDTNPWVIFAGTTGENEIINAQLYTKDVTGGIIRYFPDTGGMTSTDSASLEPGNKFIYERSAYIDTSLDVSTLTKTDAMGIIYDNTDIIGIIGDDNLNVSYKDQPTAGAGAAGLSTSWLAQTFTTTTSFDIGAVRLPLSRWYTTGSITVSIRATSAGLPTGADLTSGTLDSSMIPASSDIYDYDWYTINVTKYTLSASTKYAIVLRWVPSGSGVLDWWYLTTGYSGGNSVTSSDSGGTWWAGSGDFGFQTLGVSVTAENINSGEHTIKLLADGTNLKMYIDDVLEDSRSLGGASVPDNANDWTFCQDDSVIYMEYQKFTRDGTLTQNIEWEYGARFNDQTAYNNDVTPTFRTTSSDADIAAELTTLEPASPTGSPDTDDSTGSWKLITENPDEPSGLFTELNMNFFGAGLLINFSTTTGIPIAIPVFIYCFGISTAAGLIAYRITMGKFSKINPTGEGRKGSLFLQAVVSGIFMTYFATAGGGVIPWWIIAPFLIEAVAAQIWRQNPYSLTG